MHKRSLVLCALLLVVALVASCGGGGGETNVPPPGAPGGAPAFDMSKANATITGKISFEGTPPPNDKIQMSADPYCAQHAAQNPTTETVKVSDGGLENVIVYVSSGLPAGATYAPPTTPVEINQENCHYIPHVFTMMTNQPLKVKNSDMTLHNIHAWAEKNPQYNVGQPVKDMVSETKFAKPEVPCRSAAMSISGWARLLASSIIPSIRYRSPVAASSTRCRQAITKLPRGMKNSERRP